MRILNSLVLLGILFAGRLPAAAIDFAAVVRKTEPLAPEDERRGFHLPPGFEAQLVASEPEINKPINLNFDAAGRLWVTSTIEYPHPAKDPENARDSIKILSDFAPNGKARKVVTFAEHLNIPVGVLPYGNGAIGHSIPFIYQFEDTKNAGHSDARKVLLDRIGFERDTHGMSGNFVRGFDGWIYATHGFNNISTVKALDGSAITMQSGNTYRFRPDGSHIEQYTWGQVNPFGLALDALGNLYSADCETLPMCQLLRGAYYPSFGRKDDGLGFGPAMMTHRHGSTAIGGILINSDTRWPAEFHDNGFVGNVMTCKINRDQLVDTGTTRLAKELPDFLSADDPWFRPVCLKYGPDGALYVADFYNRIIGHYEVSLTHPGRDRERGRIWRIVYKGTPEQPVADVLPPDLTQKSAADLVALTGDNNLTLRMLAMWQLVDRIGAASVEPLKAVLTTGTPNQKVCALWALFNQKSLSSEALAALCGDADFTVRTHAMKALAELPEWSAAQRASALAALKDSSPWVQRAAAEALGLHPTLEGVRPLIALRRAANPADTHFVHAVRIALRNHLLVAGIAPKIVALNLDADDWSALADVALGAHSEDAGELLLHVIKNGRTAPADAAKYLQHAISNLPLNDLETLVTLAREKLSGDTTSQLALIKSIQEGAAKRGIALGANARAWAGEIVAAVLTEKPPVNVWIALALDGTPNPKNPWVPQKRKCADGKEAAFLCSFPLGETLTGIYRSAPFPAPAKLSFFLAGHNGLPPAAHPIKNSVRLLDAATREQLMEAAPPRNDMAQRVEWNLEKFAGRSCILELIDGDDATAYAWLAAGRFEPAVVGVPEAADMHAENLIAAVKLVGDLKLASTAEKINALLDDAKQPAALRAAAATALTALDLAAHVPQFCALTRDPATAPVLRDALVDALAAVDAPEARAALVEALKLGVEKQQIRIAQALSGNRAGAGALLDAIAAGQASPRLLFDNQTRERLAQAKLDGADERIAKLTKGLPPPDQQVQKLIDKRVKNYATAKTSLATGAKVFEKTCMICHSMEGKGASIGPQLDGVGARGLDRIVEDVLDPSRNVDAAFRLSVVKLVGGQVFSGLKRREEGAQIVFADSKGVETPVAKQDIKEIRETQMSLMPDGLVETMSPEEFNDLLAFLLSKTVKR